MCKNFKLCKARYASKITLTVSTLAVHQPDINAGNISVFFFGKIMFYECISWCRLVDKSAKQLLSPSLRVFKRSKKPGYSGVNVTICKEKKKKGGEKETVMFYGFVLVLAKIRMDVFCDVCDF